MPQTKSPAAPSGALDEDTDWFAIAVLDLLKPLPTPEEAQAQMDEFERMWAARRANR